MHLVILPVERTWISSFQCGSENPRHDVRRRTGRAGTSRQLRDRSRPRGHRDPQSPSSATWTPQVRPATKACTTRSVVGRVPDGTRRLEDLHPWDLGWGSPGCTRGTACDCCPAMRRLVLPSLLTIPDHNGRRVEWKKYECSSRIRAVSRMRSTSIAMASSSNGFSTYSVAPCRIACTASRIDPNPVMTITGAAPSSSLSCSSSVGEGN